MKHCGLAELVGSLNRLNFVLLPWGVQRGIMSTTYGDVHVRPLLPDCGKEPPGGTGKTLLPASLRSPPSDISRGEEHYSSFVQSSEAGIPKQISQ